MHISTSHTVIPSYSSKDKNQSQKFCLRNLCLPVVEGFLSEKSMDGVSGQVVPRVLKSLDREGNGIKITQNINFLPSYTVSHPRRLGPSVTPV
jgi:hypothetical protein